MERNRFDAAPLLAGLGALILLIALFLDWFEPGISAWTSFEVLDLLLAGVAIAALLALADALDLAHYVPKTLLVVLGAIAFVIVASQLIDRPPAAEGAGLEEGAWLAFAASVLMLLGGIAAAASISLAVSVDRKGPGEPAEREAASPVPPASRPETAVRRPESDAMRAETTEPTDTSATLPLGKQPPAGD
ncbi:MAG: hypothetical protein H0V29_11925 [Thermoleophilaceae bacterium]|nr:hypothetical protein [Thermoleophilaceae bacterium]